MGASMYPERDDVLVVRRSVETHERRVEDAWDVQTLSGEILAVQCPTREHAEGEARRIARYRQVSIFYEHDPSRADSVLEFVVTYRISDAAPVA
jgi:hypothetical protein